MNGLNTETAYRLFVGVDISAATAAVAWMKPDSKVKRPFTIDQTPLVDSNLLFKLITGC